MKLLGKQIIMSEVVLLWGGRFIREGEPTLRIEKPCETIELCKKTPLEEDWDSTQDSDRWYYQQGGSWGIEKKKCNPGLRIKD